MSVRQFLARLVAVGAVAIYAGSTRLDARPIQSLEPFFALNAEALGSAQMKLNALGAETEKLPSLVLTVQGHPIDWQALASWQLPEDADDSLAQKTYDDKPFLPVSGEEFVGLVRHLNEANDAIERIRERLPQTDLMPWLICTLTARTPAGVIGAQVTMSQREAQEFFVLVRNTLRADPKDVRLLEARANREAMRTLQGWGCAFGVLPDGIPAKDVTDAIRVDVGGLRWNIVTQRFGSTVTLTNVSRQPIRGPIALVVDFSDESVRLVNATGTTCNAFPVGRNFIQMPMPAESLAPGQALETVLVFERDEGVEIRFVSYVLAGSGER